MLQCTWGKSIRKKITRIHCCIPKYPKFSIFVPTYIWVHQVTSLFWMYYQAQHSQTSMQEKKKKRHTSHITKTDNYLSKYKNLPLSKYKMKLHSTGETDYWRAQTEPCTHQDPGERSSDPTRDWPRLDSERPGVSGRGVGGQWPASGLGAMSVAVCAWDFMKEDTIVFITCTTVWPQVK